VLHLTEHRNFALRKEEEEEVKQTTTTHPTLPSREGELDPGDVGAWSLLKVRLKTGLCSTPGTVLAAKRWGEICSRIMALWPSTTASQIGPDFDG
jgi:hypothetical protein